jgi:hypothetical protein
MPTHVHTSSTLCGEQVGSKDEVVSDLEIEKQTLLVNRTLSR